jgi:hypothetical protein
MSIRSEHDRTRKERERGWIINLLYHARTRTLEFFQLRKLLDQRNFALSTRALAEHIDYLCELRLIQVELGGQTRLDNGALRRALQRYADSDVEGHNESIFARLTAAGVNLQEGVGAPIEGIASVE